MNMLEALDDLSLQDVQDLLFTLEQDIMDNMMAQKILEGKMVFSEVENGLPN